MQTSKGHIHIQFAVRVPHGVAYLQPYVYGVTHFALTLILQFFFDNLKTVKCEVHNIVLFNSFNTFLCAPYRLSVF